MHAAAPACCRRRRLCAPSLRVAVPAVRSAPAQPPSPVRWSRWSGRKRSWRWRARRTACCSSSCRRAAWTRRGTRAPRHRRVGGAAPNSVWWSAQRDSMHGTRGGMQRQGCRVARLLRPAVHLCCPRPAAPAPPALCRSPPPAACCAQERLQQYGKKVRRAVAERELSRSKRSLEVVRGAALHAARANAGLGRLLRAALSTGTAAGRHGGTVCVPVSQSRCLPATPLPSLCR